MRTLTFHMIAGLLAVGLVFGVNFAQAQAGTLDPNFGTDGTVTTIFTGAASPVMMPIGAAQQANGNIVVLSEFDFVEGFGTQIGLTCCTSAGKLDKAFGTKGSTITNFSPSRPTACWTQPLVPTAWRRPSPVQTFRAHFCCNPTDKF